ncbi:uncharacterized protein LOC143285688 [Babylonia areolata]|uniref:uncharacterized protein LOC143285688 n=1 Tax=Babylonia areolata TaxID=304850 RepID=UPI003FD2DA78
MTYTSETSVVTHTDLVKGLHGEVTKSVTTIRAEDCPKAQWKHPSRGCLKLQCSKGKVAGPGQQCVTAVDRVRGLGYRLKMALQPVALTTRLRLPSDATTTTPSTTEPTSSQTPLSVPVTNDSQSQHTQKHDCDYRAVLNEAIKHVFWAVSTEVSSTLTAAATQDQACFYHKYRASLDTLMADGKVRPHATDNVVGVVEREIGEADQLSASFLAAVAEVNVVASQKEGRDDVESKALRKVFAKNWTVDLGQWTVTLRALDMTSGLFKDGEGAAGFVHLKGGDTDQSSFRFFKMNPTEPLDGLEHLFLPLSDLLVCQHLRFHEDEFEVEVSQRKVEIRFPNYLDADLQPVSFDARDYSSKLRLVGEELVMCHYVYLDVFPENVTVVHPGRGVSLARQITSIVCSSISVLCLAATFLTYSLFSELRSLPGLNNMGLCFTLAIAHLSLLIPWLRSSGSENVCVAVGVVTHWLWLTALLWMNVGCVHMVRVFFAKTRHALTQREVKKAFLHNVLFTVLLSVGAVALTAVVTVAVSGGASTGYGGKLCFLDTGFDPLLILAFLLPLGGVVVTNLLCFLLTVVAIMRVRRLQATVGSARRDVLVYAKLATVTGLGWVLVVLAEFSGHQEWLLVLAELCTASQGLLLFLSYVCNTRVWRMYRARFGSSRAPSAPIPASTTTVVTMSDSTKAPPPADA